MTGRARGRSRGRGRGGAGGDAARRPGEGTQHSVPEQVAPVGRGRSRGPPPAQAAAVAPQPQQKPVAPPTEAMAAMSVRQEQRPPVGTTGSAEQRPPRRQIPSEPATKPAHVVDKKGVTGKSIPLVSNHFRLMTKPSFGVYQYNVSFNPELESKRLRVALLKSQSEVIGQVHAFDGMMLFLPKRLPDPVTKFNLETRSGNAVEMTITLTNEIPKDSPSMLQLYNIIFRRFVFFLYLFLFFGETCLITQSLCIHRFKFVVFIFQSLKTFWGLQILVISLVAFHDFACAPCHQQAAIYSFIVFPKNTTKFVLIHGASITMCTLGFFPPKIQKCDKFTYQTKLKTPKMFLFSNVPDEWYSILCFFEILLCKWLSCFNHLSRRLEFNRFKGHFCRSGVATQFILVLEAELFMM